MIWRLVPLVALVSACDPAPPPRVDSDNPVLRTQIQAMEKARALEVEVRDTAEGQRQQIESASQP